MIILTSKCFVFNLVGKLVRGFRIVTKMSYEEFGSESPRFQARCLKDSLSRTE